jgi:3-oxoacyl-[acyl-carrier protein] reductase
VTAADPSRPTAGRPLAGRVALVTGVSRRVGIGLAVARRLAALGAGLFVTSWAAHDREQPWGADPGGLDAVLAELGGGDAATPGAGRVEHLEADLQDPEAPDRVMAAAVEAFGHVDILVCNHARSSARGLGELTAAELDATLAVNTRAVLLLVQAFAAQHDRRPGGRVVLFSSGQHLGPMPGELAYAASKGALVEVTASLADALADRGITVNTINPGPTDTDYVDQATRERVARRFPAGRWGAPDDAARLVAWLCTDDAAWVTGQVINSEGGFRRFG